MKMSTFSILDYYKVDGWLQHRELQINCFTASILGCASTGVRTI